MQSNRLYVGIPDNVNAEHAALTMLDDLRAVSIDAATIYPAMGVWLGNTERCLVVEVYGDGIRDDLLAAGALYGTTYDQVEVLLVEHSGCSPTTWRNPNVGPKTETADGRPTGTDSCETVPEASTLPGD